MSRRGQGQKKRDFNPLAVIGSAPATCPACGADNVNRSRVCQQCGQKTRPNDEDEDRFEVVSADGVPATSQQFSKKFPVQKSKNLLLAQEAAAGIQNGSMSREDFQAKVDEARRVADQGVELFKSDMLRAKIATLPPEQQELSNQTAVIMGQALDGYIRMLRYLSSENLEDVRHGLQAVERAFLKLDHIRGRAFEIATAEAADPG